MTKPLTIVARIEAKEGNADLLKSELIKLINPTRQEKGCLQYDLHQDNANRAVFLFYENWESRKLWLQHMNSAHLKAYMEATADAVENFTLYEMSQVG